MSGLVPFIIPIVIVAVVLPCLSDAGQTVSAQPLLSCQCTSFAGAGIHSNTPFHECCGKWPPFELNGLFLRR